MESRKLKDCKMSEEETMSVEQEVAQPPETENMQDAPQETVQQLQVVRKDQEYNWNEARRKMEMLERQNSELQEKFNKMSMAQSQTQNDDLASLADDDIVTAKQARGLAEKMARQVADQAIRDREASTMEERLISKYGDFNSVVTKENIDIFNKNEPELAMSLQALAYDPYAQATAAYKMLKKYGLGVSEEVAKNKQRALDNSKKPVSVQSVTKQSSAIGNVSTFENGLTPELQKQLWKEMQEAKKGY
jgi:hypothetical protein